MKFMACAAIWAIVQLAAAVLWITGFINVWVFLLVWLAVGASWVVLIELKEDAWSSYSPRS